MGAKGAVGIDTKIPSGVPGTSSAMPDTSSGMPDIPSSADRALVNPSLKPDNIGLPSGEKLNPGSNILLNVTEAAADLLDVRDDDKKKVEEDVTLPYTIGDDVDKRHGQDCSRETLKIETTVAAQKAGGCLELCS